MIRRALSAFLLAGALAGCRSSLSPIVLPAGSRSAVDLREGADELFAALSNRYGILERAPKFARARQRIGQFALIPSRVFDDTAIWTVLPAPSVRILLAHGEPRGTGYFLRPVTSMLPLDALGDARHTVVLTQLGEGEYRWDTSVDYAVGSIGARPAAALLSAFFTSADGRRGADIPVDYLGAFPRTSAVLGTLFSVDSIRTLPLRDGSTAVTLALSMHTDRLAVRYPLLAGYLERYVGPARWKAALRDPAGMGWMTGEAGKQRMTVRFRTAGGHFAPLAGMPRPMPDTLAMDLDFSMKVGLFTVGFDQLHMLLARINTPHEASWEFIAQQEPDWRLPLIAEKLIHAPLKRPFEGEGSHFRIGFRDDGGTTLLARHAQIPVQESAIMRFIGRLGATAFGDISPAVEQQEAQYLRSVFQAMRADLADIGS